jgi:STE24 endopeptidase
LSATVLGIASGSVDPPLLNVMAASAIAGLALSILIDLSALPFLFYSRYVLERRYHVSKLALGIWSRAYAQGMGVHSVVWMSSAMTLYTIVHLWPVEWWLVAGVIFLLITVATTYLGPRIVLPRLYNLRPIARPDLRARLDTLTRRVGTPVVEIQEWPVKDGSSRPAAALVGLGSTRRILLADTLLADYSDDEIEVVTAHELAHYIHHDGWQTIACEGVVFTLACGAAHLVLDWTAPAFGLSGIRDVAGLPVLAMVAGGVEMALAPVRNFLSRRQERRADRYALEVTNNPEALASTLRRWGSQTLAEERPSRLVEWFFYSHPSLGDRTAAAQSSSTMSASGG